MPHLKLTPGLYESPCRESMQDITAIINTDITEVIRKPPTIFT
jgi:hypothetical protein